MLKAGRKLSDFIFFKVVPSIMFIFLDYFNVLGLLQFES